MLFHVISTFTRLYRINQHRKKKELIFVKGDNCLFVAYSCNKPFYQIIPLRKTLLLFDSPNDDPSRHPSSPEQEGL